MIYLKNRLSNVEELSEIKEQLFEKLEGLLIIHDANNRLKQAKHFYDRTVRVFEVMLPEKLFIPKDFFKKEVYHFYFKKSYESCLQNLKF